MTISVSQSLPQSVPSGEGGARVAIIAIGRNEGARLETCLKAAVRMSPLVVYVDSGSTDGSCELAKKYGAQVVNLDLSIPFTAARARNEGFARAISVNPDLEFVQFIDGDCELVDGFIDRALQTMHDKPRAACVCGRRRERFPDASIYNQLCDMEWNTPIGQAKACGGDVLIRVSALKEVNGYNPDVIAGEEPEMCVRLRQKNWEIWRIDSEMTLHDAAMTKFNQWWKRNYRAGHAYAEGFDRHGAPPECFRQKEVKSNWVWGMLWFVPLVWPLHVLQAIRIGLRRKSMPYGFSVMIGKLPQMLGQRKYFRNKSQGRREKIIEYKGART